MKKKIKHKQQPAEKKSSPKKPKVSKPENWKYYVALFIIILISFFSYLPVFNNELLAWDDKYYIKENPLVYSINLKDIFSQYVMGNYHPFTILIVAIEYQLFGLNATGYHTINLLLHLMNVLLVFFTVLRLANKKEIALVASLLFGIHPLHVESVAWAAELKDLLYTFFFLASYIFYLKFQGSHQRKYYIIALILFAVSLLSKAMAASLPVLLILTDYFMGRKINTKTLLEKAPFFLLSIVVGIVAIRAQQSAGATDVIHLSFFQRMIFACYGFITYIVQLIFPLNLSAYYPYPVTSGERIPAQYYLYPALFAGLVVAIFYSLRVTKKIFFGIGFYAITIFLVLQLLPVGGAIIADRYSYIPSIGIFYLAGEGFYYLWNQKSKWLATILLFAFATFFSIKTYTRCNVWKNDLVLWNDVIEQYQTIPLAYNNRGHTLLLDSKTELALEDFNKAIELNPNYVKAYNNRGTALINMNRNDDALKDFDKAISLMPGWESIYVGRGNALKNKNMWQEALKAYNKAIELKPDYADAFYARAFLYSSQGKNSESLEDYTKAIELNNNYIEAYLNRGNLLRDMNRFDEALQDYGKVISLNPGFHLAYFNRGNLYMNRKMNDLAIQEFDKAIDVKPDYVKAYLNKASVYNNEKKYEEAIRTYSKALEYKKDYAEAFYGRGLAEYYSGKKNVACSDMKQASRLGYQPASAIVAQICN